jgi:hypothetical protein
VFPTTNHAAGGLFPGVFFAFAEWVIEPRGRTARAGAADAWSTKCKRMTMKLTGRAENVASIRGCTLVVPRDSTFPAAFARRAPLRRVAAAPSRTGAL